LQFAETVANLLRCLIGTHSMSRDQPRLLLSAAVLGEIAPLSAFGWTPLPTMQVERWPLRRWRVDGAEVVAVATGVGMEACRDATIAIDADRRIDGLICLGLAGAARAGLGAGAICISERIIITESPSRETLQPHSAILDVLRRAASDAGWQFGTGLSSPTVVPDPESKASVAAECGCDWIEMESGGAARMGQRLAVPWAVIRAIGDTVADDLNGSFGALRNERGQLQWFQAIKKVVSDPRALQTAWRLRRQEKAAAEALAGAMGLLVPAIIGGIRRGWI
jgi:nucleoside phosphorylase